MTEPTAFMDDAFIPARDARISILEPTFTKSDCVYDTVSVWKSLLFRLDDHLERFGRSCAAMELKPPYNREQTRRIVAECIDRSGYEDACVTLIATRGPFESLENRDLRACRNGLIAVAVPYYWVLPKAKMDTGIAVVIPENRRYSADAVDARAKNFNWMDLTKGLLQAFQAGGDSAVLCTPDGKLSEGPGFNVWMVKDGRLLTPRGNLLEGITRKSVFELAKDMGVDAREVDLYPDDLREADEAFTSTTAGGITPVTQVDGRPLGNGAPGILTTQITKTYWQKREAGWHGTPVKQVLATTAPLTKH